MKTKDGRLSGAPLELGEPRRSRPENLEAEGECPVYETGWFLEVGRTVSQVADSVRPASFWVIESPRPCNEGIPPVVGAGKSES